MRRLIILSAAAVCFWAVPAWASMGNDTLTLKDGRVVQGQIVSEDGAKVVITVSGVKRIFERDLVASIAYGTDNGAGAQAPSTEVEPEAVPAPEPAVPTKAEENAQNAQLAEQYGVSVKDVVWVREQGIAPEDVPEVLDTAARAQVPLGKVVALRQKGASWESIHERLGLAPAPEPRPRAHVEVVAPAVVMAPVLVPPPNILLKILFWPFMIFRHMR